MPAGAFKGGNIGAVSRGESLQQSHLAACLKTGFKKEVPITTRQRIVTKIPEWAMLNKPWKAMLVVALNELTPPDDEDSTPNVRTRSMRGRRRQRSTSSGPMDLLPTVEEILLDSTLPDAYRLAALLLRKTLEKDSWDDSNDTDIDNLRESCLNNGVHSVWQTMAEACPILAQFAAFPVAEKEQRKEIVIDLSHAWINPSDSTQMAQAMTTLSPLISTPANQVSMRRLISQLEGDRSVKDVRGLAELKGQAVVISVLIGLHQKREVSGLLKVLAKEDKLLSARFSLYSELMNGLVMNWHDAVSLTDEDHLSREIVSKAWSLAPEQAAEESSQKLAKGIACITDSSVKEKLQWWRLSALVSEGSKKEAIEVLTSLKIEADSDTQSLLSLIKKLGDDGFDWFAEQLDSLDQISISYVIVDDELPASMRLTAVAKAQHENHIFGPAMKSAAITILTEGCELEGLAALVLEDESSILQSPFEVMLVYHLLSAKTVKVEFETLKNAHQLAQTVILDCEAPESFSDAAQALLLLMDGASVDDTTIVNRLDKNGILSFNKCRQALRSGGDGLAENKELDALSVSVEKADFSILERKLFNAVMGTLHLNRVTTLLQSTKNGSVSDTLDDLLAAEVTPMVMMHTVKHLVMEHDLGLPNLVSWFQRNDPLSPWHTLSRAALHAKRKEELNAARDYHKAGDDSEFDYEHKIILHRKALIHYAHAGEWTEAVNLFEEEAALNAALTKRFQLYLRVSDKANKGETQEATRLLKSFVKSTKMVWDEEEEKDVERTFYAEDDLDMLRNYPMMHPRKLPSEPFCGRVKAAVNILLKHRRRTKYNFEKRYNQAMQLAPVSMEEVYEIAQDAGKIEPFDGLMYLERAQSSGKFSLLDVRRLADAEKSLYSLNNRAIPLRKRAYLRKLSLSPLVIVDTNILIDELRDRMNEHLDLYSEYRLDISGQGRFHRILLRRAEDDAIYLWMPKIVQNELKDFCKDLSRVRALFENNLVKKERLDEEITDELIQDLCNSIIDDFTTWRPMDLNLEDEVEDEVLAETLNDFLRDHLEIYEELTIMKRSRGEPIRTEIDGNDVYPESNDIKIMHLASVLTERSVDDIGCLLVATKDGDFNLVARAIEEKLGFGIVKNSRTLQAWLAR